LHEWIAGIHVHSTYSDGTGTMPEILDAARDAGLDVLISTEHDCLRVKREGWEGRHDGVLLIAGAEVTPFAAPHCTALRIDHCCGYSQMAEEEYLAAIGAQDGFAMVAHPQGLVRPALGIRQPSWTHWRHPVVRGFELWSYLHDWIQDFRGWRMLKAWAFWKHPERMIRGPQKQLLKTWDTVAQGRRLAAMSGLDCHARRIDFLNWIIFPYRQMFETVRTHLFTEEPPGSANEIDTVLDAIAEGRSFIAYDGLADATGLWAEAETPSERLLVGEEADFGGPTRLRITLPRKGQVTLIADGQPIHHRTAEQVEFVASQPGVFRFEVRLDGRAWVFTNPFYLR